MLYNLDLPVRIGKESGSVLTFNYGLRRPNNYRLEK